MILSPVIKDFSEGVGGEGNKASGVKGWKGCGEKVRRAIDAELEKWFQKNPDKWV